MGLFDSGRPHKETGERLDRLESQFRLLQVEHEEMVEKVLNALARLSKRERDASRAAPPTDASPAPSTKAALWSAASKVLGGTRAVR